MIVLGILFVWFLHEFLMYRERFMWLIPLFAGIFLMVYSIAHKQLEAKCTEQGGILVASHCVDGKSVIDLK